MELTIRGFKTNFAKLKISEWEITADSDFTIKSMSLLFKGLQSPDTITMKLRNSDGEDRELITNLNVDNVNTFQPKLLLELPPRIAMGEKLVFIYDNKNVEDVNLYLNLELYKH